MLLSLSASQLRTSLLPHSISKVTREARGCRSMANGFPRFLSDTDGRQGTTGTCRASAPAHGHRASERLREPHGNSDSTTEAQAEAGQGKEAQPGSTAGTRRRTRPTTDTSASSPSSRTSRSKPQKRSVLRAWRALFGAYIAYATWKQGSRRGIRAESSQRWRPIEGAADTPRARGLSSLCPNFCQSSTDPGYQTSHLGKFAHEKEMPSWLVKVLDKNGQVCTGDVLPVLKQLLDQCPSTKYAYLCHPCVQHVSKLRREGEHNPGPSPFSVLSCSPAYPGTASMGQQAVLGAFCGYRNIQMLISYVIGARAPGSRRFGDCFPTVFQIQDLIEHAWDMGYNSQGRVETGGIRGTRKFIGTPEVPITILWPEALQPGGRRSIVLSIRADWLTPTLGTCAALQPRDTSPLLTIHDSRCSAQAFRDAESGQARRNLLQAVEQYFEKGWRGGSSAKARSTALPPIYLQHHAMLTLGVLGGHSVTVVGMERQQDNQVHLLVFDPSRGDSDSMKRLIGKLVDRGMPKTGELLEPYRRGTRYLSKHDEFEILW
ncbi:Zinc finger protein-like protein [Tolypocladium paradoxum]|uniref:Zinc finger protein-like protein n=1 Tax=Tolypocladium paradoxum TaxID=94208 RepID=A0A2S4KUV7_9HYPO|nr:Zinc finger protein-like protein [Tolypocladium paradoxum]